MFSVAACARSWASPSRFALMLLVSISALTAPVTAQEKRPMTTDDLLKTRRLTDPQISPDGKWIAYTVTEVNTPENRTDSDIWLVAAAGDQARQLTHSPKHDRHPRWSPDGRWIAFESN